MRSSSWNTPALPIRSYSSTEKRRAVNGMPILSVLRKRESKGPTWCQDRLRSGPGVIETLPTGAISMRAFARSLPPSVGYRGLA